MNLKNISQGTERMLRIIKNHRGISIIEMMVAVVITMIGVLSIFMLQSSSWKTVAKSDYLGRASQILANELQRQESLICNRHYFVEIGTKTFSVKASDPDADGVAAAAISGDAVYTMSIKTENIGTEIWRVTVTVSWPPLNPQGITENLVITRQARCGF